MHKHPLATALQVATSLAVLASTFAPAAAATFGGPRPQAPVFQNQDDNMPAWLSPDRRKKKKKPLLYVGDNANNQISVFDANTKIQNPAPIQVIKTGLNGPQGITTDKAGNLYVANLYGNNVVVYAPRASSPKLTLSSGINTPVDVKVDGFGNVYVANSPGLGASSFILEFPSGSMQPSTEWFAPPGEALSSFALINPDTSPSIYAAEYTLNQSGFATGGLLSCYPGNANCVSLGYTFGQTGGIAIEESPGYSNPFEFLVVDQYVPGVDQFQPLQHPGAMTGQLVTGGTPEFLTLNATRKDLFVADRFYGRVTEYTFPGGQVVNNFYPAGGGDTTQIYGVAVTPASTYF